MQVQLLGPQFSKQQTLLVRRPRQLQRLQVKVSEPRIKRFLHRDRQVMQG